jgi:hypothetical protein
MNFMRIERWSYLLLALLLGAVVTATAEAKKKVRQDDGPTAASIYGLEGETYWITGTGGITVTQSPPHGRVLSSSHVFQISVDGSGIANSNPAAGKFPFAR